jgi:hypothetical protein
MRGSLPHKSEIKSIIQSSKVELTDAGIPRNKSDNLIKSQKKARQNSKYLSKDKDDFSKTFIKRKYFL